MITVSKQTNGVLFTFQDSNMYLYGNGTILVPFNSLSIIQDESNMITLRKSASNDIFISARYDDMGYASKEAAVEALKGILFAKSEGGGGSVDPDEVRAIVEEETSGMTEDIATLEANKFDGASYNSANHTIVFTANGVQKATIDASDFIKDGMVSNVEIANDNLVITFNTDAGKSPISIPLTNFFDPTILDDYFTKSEVTTALADKMDVSGMSAYATTATTYSKSEVDNAITAATSTKQDTLVSGTNIKTINGESILGEGNITIEGGGGAGLDDDTQQLISTALNDLNDRKADLTELTKYQKKGDYVVTSTLADYMTNDAFDEYATANDEYLTAKERIISGALNDLNERLLDVITRLEALENA